MEICYFGQKNYQKRQYYEIFDRKTPTTLTLCMACYFKKENNLDIFSFEYGAISITKRKHSELSLAKIKTKFSKYFSFAVKFGILEKVTL